ncbi:MAG: DUF2470 domain-containing protein [Nitrospira sp.]|nr:DUF2470 domain-containing protein [Nitrospira sp.]
MAQPKTHEHSSPARGPSEPEVPEPSLAERARTLMHLGPIGSLCTLSLKRPGWPFGSIMPYALDSQGRPIFLISTMAMHTKNLLADARASLLVAQPEVAGDPLGAARVTLMGQVDRVPKDESDAVRHTYLARHANASYWVDFGDFAFYRMAIVDVYYVGGFGVMGWVTAEDYQGACVDPLADQASGLLQRMNAERAGDLLAFARGSGYAQAEDARLTAMDRLGLHLRLRTGERVQGVRLAFPCAVTNAQDAEQLLDEMMRQAQAQA